MASEEIDWNGIAMRRAKFLIDEAASQNPKYDQTVQYALRVISNVASVGGNFGSSTVKRRNERVSAKAWELFHRSADKEWLANTVNEHPEPISQVWAWICREYKTLAPEDILDRMARHKMITITKEENAAIAKRGLRSKGRPGERHKDIDLGPKGPPRRTNMTNF